MNMMIRTYSELIRLKTFAERFEYLKLDGIVGEATFGFHRHLNQTLYRSPEWLQTRDGIIYRDKGLNLGLEIIESKYEHIIIHHINPITIEDIEMRSDRIFDPENLITTTPFIHRAIHYGSLDILKDRELIVRRPDDMIPWK